MLNSFKNRLKILNEIGIILLPDIVHQNRLKMLHEIVIILFRGDVTIHRLQPPYSAASCSQFK